MRESERNPMRSATMILVIANVAVFILQCIISAYPGGLEEWFRSYLMLSSRVFTKGFIWQTVTFQFLHFSERSNDIGFLHLAGNCLGLFWLGRTIEMELGRKRLYILYLGSGVLGGLLQALLGLMIPAYFSAPTQGASAGVCGLLAAFAARDPHAPISFLAFFFIPISMYARTLLLISLSIAAFFVVFPVWPGVAHAAHLGGLIGGILFIRLGLDACDFNFPSLRSKRVKRELVATSAFKHKGLWRPSKPSDEDDLPPAEFISKEVDPILDKISAQGIHSLTKRERAILEAARKKIDR
jgi:membrane associated rhomboid family serine protease